ncbi:C-terminal processing protease CtpA/Prc [Arenibacter algicola]|uniref:C-terminal processing protease CtpA/Prc n=1 Tax=Arenibacter algicola TaxID=616991 RepID=A0A221V429_9FLAO|nr:S41 family peptidase [Arenibacter algicola]ASO08126.1 carboxy-terminal protease [Arenibacter algicola]|tara:strand:+ start:2034 stop:3506 length:1473 start_codon:yes stop_codon:yes gene_type:complete
MKKILGLLLIAIALSCSDKDDDAFVYPKESTVQNFMWQGLNLWYFWQADAPNLGDSRFTSNDDYVAYLESYTDPEEFFYQTCYKHSKVVGSSSAIDRFSFVEDDYETLVNSLSGVSKSNGLEFGLARNEGSTDLFGYVRYIIPNSNASTKDIARGDIFTRVNGVQLNDANYISLLFGNSDTYTLGMADISGTVVTDNDKEVTLTKSEGLQEDPILVAKTVEVNGTKIAYLMYNGFTNSYNEQLNTVFGQFKTAGATELVLDLRYNPGGSVNSSRLLASMVYGTNTSELYVRQRWNDKIQSMLNKEQLEDYFANKTDSGTALNSLNLNKVYVLATGSSASASELVMNGLAPYVNVFHIGETTRGKNEFSVTMVDDVDNDYIYRSDRENKINPSNRWAMQPLMGRNENSEGFSDYTLGLTPDVVLAEDLADLGVLGDINEPLFARAIQEITGVSAKKDFSVKMPVNEISNSKMFTPLKDNMYLDKPVDITFQ